MTDLAFFVDNDGRYLTQCAAEYGRAQEGWHEVPVAPADAGQIWNFQLHNWGPVPVYVPARVTMRQARLALLGAGLLDSVEAALDAMAGTNEGKAARIEWDHSQFVERNRPFVLQIGSALGLDAAALDQLFVTAAGIE